MTITYRLNDVSGEERRGISEHGSRHSARDEQAGKVAREDRAGATEK